MNAEILTIGSELTSGVTINTNAAYLARRLAVVGIRCQRQVSVGDDPGSVITALKEALCYSDLIITTGGLGPTFDDITMEAIAEVTHRPLRYVPTVAKRIRQFYTRHHRTLQQAALRQAYLPEGGHALPNPVGTAPGLWLQDADQLLIALPGVPGEMRVIMEQSVLPRLHRVGRGYALESCTLHTIGIVELSIERILRTLHIPQEVEVGLYPHLRMVDVRLTTASSPRVARRRLARINASLRRALGVAVYGTEGDTLEGIVGSLLVKRRQTLAVAESCTGGLLADTITDVSGSSRYFRGAVIAYHNDLKRNSLAVPAAILAHHGAVSAPVARAMARGIRHVGGADVGLSVTGIAGPTGGTPRKPVGLVYLSLADRHGAKSLQCQFQGDRTAIKIQAVQTALNWLRLYLLSKAKR